MIVKPYDKSKEDKLLDFVIAHPWNPVWSLDQIREFIHHLISSTDLLFDLYNQKDERIALAVLIDKIQNKGNNACLEMLGLNQIYDVAEIYNHLIKWAKHHLPKTRSGIEITVEASLNKVGNLLLNNGFVHYYDLYEMQSYFETYFKTSDEISLISNQEFLACYQMMTEALKDNLEMSIPSYDAWKASKQSKRMATWVYKEDNKIIGFITVEANVEKKLGEIRTIGVLANHRKKGIGKKLLSHSLHYLIEQGISSCHLSVAIQNEGALKIYRDLGFEVSDHFKVYCWTPQAGRQLSKKPNPYPHQYAGN